MLLKKRETNLWFWVWAKWTKLHILPRISTFIFLTLFQPDRPSLFTELFKDSGIFIRTVRFQWSWWWWWRWRFSTGVGHLQVSGLLLTGIFTEHVLGDGDLTGPPVITAADTQTVLMCLNIHTELVTSYFTAAPHFLRISWYLPVNVHESFSHVGNGESFSCCTY